MRKTILIYILMVFTAKGQNPNQAIDINMSPNGLMENVFDQMGNKYKLSDVFITPTKISKTGATLTTSSPIAAGYFNLFFEVGSGMENETVDPLFARRNVIIKVFEDISAFINSPLATNGLNNKVNIWVRAINEINGVPSNALGLATSFSNLPHNTTNGFGGIADNEIWKTIHTGVDSYTNVTSPLITAGIYTGIPGVFYHGMLSFNFNNDPLTNLPYYNWNTNRSVLANSTQYDLYTIVLHEVIHSLGFESKINISGDSLLGPGFNYYSRYDKFLKTSFNQELLIGGSCSSMYNYTFNSSLVSNLHPSTTCYENTTECATAIKFSGSPNTATAIPVYTPNCWESGSSLSHFEDSCYTSPSGYPSGNDLYFTMTNYSNLGINKRYPKNEERLALADLGYTVQPTFGVTTTLQGTPPIGHYGSSVTNGISVAGINDGYSSLDGTFKYIGTATLTNPIIINSSTNSLIRILSNDIGADSFECLHDVYDTNATLNGLSSISGSNLSNIEYNSTIFGLHLLRYVPVNSVSGQRGNITYIFVYVLDPTNCSTPIPIDLVRNGGFEQSTSIPNAISEFVATFEGGARVCGWSKANINTTPDYFHVSAPINSFSAAIPCNHLGFQNLNTNSGLAYAGLFIIRHYGNTPNSPLLSEAIQNELASPIAPDMNYQLSFDVSLAESASATAYKFQAYLSDSLIANTTSGNNPTINNNPSRLFQSATFSTNTNGWEKVVINIPANQATNAQYLILGGLNPNTLESETRIPSNQGINGCNYENFNVNFPPNNNWVTFQTSYYYIDNVSLIPLNGSSFDLPITVCQNSILPDLDYYLTAIQQDGEFFGNGVINNGGVFLFDANLAGLGTHTITYTYTNSSNISISIYSVITVTPPTTVPSFDPIDPICPGTNLILPSTSINGISGTWSPIFNSEATTTYTFTPSSNWPCASTSTITISVKDANDPTCNTCLSNLILSTPENNSSFIYKSQNWIETNNTYTVSSSNDITMKANEYVVLKPNTHIQLNSKFHAKTEGCITSKVIQEDEGHIDKIYKVDVYPNPTESMVTINGYDQIIHKVVLYSIEGKLIFNSLNIGETTLVLNLDNYEKGVYLLVIETEIGNTYTKKVIKK